MNKPDFGYSSPISTEEKCHNPTFFNKKTHRIGFFAKEYHKDGLPGYTVEKRCVSCNRKFEGEFFQPSKENHLNKECANMEYEIEPSKNNILDGEVTIDSVKKTLTSMLQLTEDEIKKISNIKTNKDLLVLINTPEMFFSEESTLKKFQELTELMDLFGGFYYA